MAMRNTGAPAFELANFGIERELEYTQHITLATHLVPLSRRTFASADETHIRVWGPSGDVVKTTFPSNRRSMVCAMTYCPTYAAVLTTEVDLTLKAYDIKTLSLLDTFSLGQARKKSSDKGQANEKVTAMEYLPEHDWVLIGGENGCELWKLAKSNQRRTGSIGRLEHHLKLEMVRRVTAYAVLGIVADLTEKRVIIWGPVDFAIYDTELSLITTFQKPHAEPIRCASIQILSILDTALLTGSEDCAVNFWMIQGRQTQYVIDDLATALTDQDSPTASMRLEHSFKGHTRPVEVVCFYHRKETGMNQRLCVSHARDGKMKVWSLIQFSLVYTLDASFLDSKVSIFPLSQHFFAVAALVSGGAGQAQRTTVTLFRFTAQMASPFATTNQSPVMLISKPPPPNEVPVLLDIDGEEGDDDSTGTSKPALSRKSTSFVQPSAFSGAVALVSEDVAIRIVDAEEKRVIATLPPPPNSKVQVLRVFLCPVWQLLILWLSSQEIAIFFVPKPQDDKEAASEVEKKHGDNRAVKSTTPLLIRRFSILEVRAHMFDKELPKESFRSVALHHGLPLPCVDSIALSQGAMSKTKQDASPASSQHDWFLVVGTNLGTLQAFQVSQILAASPIWEKIAKHLEPGAWQPPSSAEQSNAPWLSGKFASEIEKQRLQAFEEELREAIESARVPGQRPFPRDASPVRFHGRWRCHDYFVEETEAVSDRVLTMDMKLNLKIWHVETMHCVFRHRLGEFSCYALYLQPELPGSGSTSPWRKLRSKASFEDASNKSRSASTLTEKTGNVERLGLAGINLANLNGSLQLVMVDSADPSEDPEVLQSAASHTKAIVQIDFIWPINVFASIGKDDTVKIWTHGLMLLREIFFPQPLTAMSFRHRHDFATKRGHGDLLLGFACHVEELTFEYWSRGIEDTMIGKSSNRGRGTGNRSSHATRRGLPLLDISDDIGDHEMWLHAENPNDVRRYMLERKGVNLQGAALVSRFLGAMIEKVRAPAENTVDVALERLKHGEVTDFRGEPLIEVGILAIPSANQDVLEVSKRRSREPTVHYQHSDYHDRGDFAEITHADSGYYDKLICPSTVVDAPRSHAIRGGGDPSDTAVITSIGTRHLRCRAEDEGRQEPRTPKSRSESVGPDKAESVTTSEQPAGTSTKGSLQPEPPKNPRSKQMARPSRRELQPSAAERSSLQSGSQSRASQSEVAPVERGQEPWRNKLIARGVPRTVNVTSRPTLQTAAHSENDSAKLLNDRGNICEVPDLPEENLLKSLVARKAEWLYGPSNSPVLNAKRRTIETMVHEKGKKQTWTPAGRLVCGEGMPPREAVPPIATAPPPHLLKMRMPMTRSEVTEQRIIEAACAPPMPPPNFTIEARAPSTVQSWVARQQAEQATEHRNTPTSARASSSAGMRGRSPARAAQQGLTSNSIDAAVGVPLTAR